MYCLLKAGFRETLFSRSTLRSKCLVLSLNTQSQQGHMALLQTCIVNLIVFTCFSLRDQT